MYAKADIYNLAIGMLLLQRQIAQTDTDPSNECKVMNIHYDAAFQSTLEDMDLDSTSTEVTLQLLMANPNAAWDWAYKYPDNCAFMRRIKSCEVMDNRSSRILKRIGMFVVPPSTVPIKTVFTTQCNAVAEIIMSNVPLGSLTATAGLAVAAKLAMLSAPLIVGKGSDKLRKEIQEKYVIFKAQAQEQDQRENFNFQSDALQSEFVEERTS